MDNHKIENLPCVIFAEAQKNILLVWKFEDAPKEFQELSASGGDEDWIVYIPSGYFWNTNWIPEWLSKIDSLSDPYFVDLPNNAVIYIGSH